MRLPLYGGKRGCSTEIVGYAIVDRQDFNRLSRFRWNLARGGYAYRRDYTHGRPGVMFYLHRVIMKLNKGDRRQVDHRNRDKLDCRRKNMRIVTPEQQGHNLAAVRAGKFSSQFRGVSWDKKTGKWVAYVCANRRKTVAGYFIDEKEAAAAARALRMELFTHALD